MSSNSNEQAPFHRSQSSGDTNSTQPRILLTHSSSIPSFQRRTAEAARHLRHNFNNVLQSAMTLTSHWPNQATVSEVPTHSATTVNIHQQGNDGSFVINLEEIVVDTTSNNNNNNNRQSEGVANVNNNNNITANITNNNSNNNNNNNPAEDSNNPERLQTVLEAQEAFQVLLKYVPFLLILLSKAVYDYHGAIFTLIILFSAFVHSNSTVKKEATKRHRRSLSGLCLELVYIGCCMMLISFVFKDEFSNVNILFNLILIRTFTHPLSVGNLLWIVTVTDFLLKLLTIILKIFLTILPGRVVSFQKRGKMYLFIEASSQMYRSIATIQPWLYYLLESYHGPEKIVAVFLSAFYMISKGTDLMGRVKLLKTAFFKLLQNVTIGSSPSKEQIQTASEHCPICHGDYESPVLLHCRHIFCESCISTWLDREQTCPLCRAKIVDDPLWRDGSTSFFLQLY